MKRLVLFVAACLIITSAILIAFRILWLGYPLLPSTPAKVWRLNVEMQVRSADGEVAVALGLPAEDRGRRIVEEKVTSGDLPFNILRDGISRTGVWEGRAAQKAPSEYQLSYGATLRFRSFEMGRREAVSLPAYPAWVTQADQRLLERFTTALRKRELDSRIDGIMEGISGNWVGGMATKEDEQRLSDLIQHQGMEPALRALFRAAGVPARTTDGLPLKEGIYNQPEKRIEAWNGRAWSIVDPLTGEVDKEGRGFLPITEGAGDAVRASRGEIGEVRWSLAKDVMSQWRLHFEGVRSSTHFLDRWSLLRLPSEFQAIFHILLLVPIGALLVCVLKNMIGFPAFGIFMPVLMAISFRMTGLFYGLGIFGGVLLVGYVMRRLLDRFRLLLVPRMSVLLTFVILCFTVLAVAGNKVGLRSFMAVGLLPFVILTMIIERFFVIVEESGVMEAVLTSAGSAAVAMITYAIISWEPLQLTFFIYPELLLAVAGIQLLIGRYTGYRLSELIRFRSFRDLS